MNFPSPQGLRKATLRTIISKGNWISKRVNVLKYLFGNSVVLTNSSTQSWRDTIHEMMIPRRVVCNRPCVDEEGLLFSIVRTTGYVFTRRFKCPT